MYPKMSKQKLWDLVKEKEKEKERLLQGIEEYWENVIKKKCDKYNKTFFECGFVLEEKKYKHMTCSFENCPMNKKYIAEQRKGSKREKIRQEET